MSNFPAPGFMMPPSAPTNQGFNQGQSGYPQQQHHQHYPPPQPGYPPYQNQPFPPPIQQQPGQPGGAYAPGNQVNWFANAPFQSYLSSATSFHVKQKVELLEALVGWETGNQYTVKDQSGHKIFYVGEESGCCNRQVCANIRPFTLIAKDQQGNNVLIFDRGLNCTCCFGFCCPDSLTVSTPSGQVIGSVEEECHILFPSFKLKDATGNTLLRIEGPLCPMTFGCGPAVFKVLNNNGVPVGTISKEWSGLVRELFTDADFFSMSFPIDLDPSMKAVCLGALFLIDFEYFEHGSSGHQGGRRLFG